ncbi:MAG: zinc-ribbon domain-containing protein [Clostridiales bacterium]|jgi:hypothetical protein|nr:zinc-ribbon domain-containing protein [Clostridiales bacterium]
MFCYQCGKQNQDDVVFCGFCGTKIGTQETAQGQQSNNRLCIELHSMPTATLFLANIAMFKVKNTGIVVEMDGVWGEKTFLYLNPKEKLGDYNKLFAALQEITKNMVMQFHSEGNPVVPIYRMKKTYANDWWKRLEIDIEGAGNIWFQYPDKNALHADYNILMSLMRNDR